MNRHIISSVETKLQVEVHFTSSCLIASTSLLCHWMLLACLSSTRERSLLGRSVPSDLRFTLPSACVSFTMPTTSTSP